MRLKLTNLGRIASADIDIRPLTVFIGENGTNKTWAAYALHALLRPMSRRGNISGFASHIGVQLPAEVRESVVAVWQRAKDSPSEKITVRMENAMAERATENRLAQEGISTVLDVDSAALPGAEAVLTYRPIDFPSRLKRLDFALEDGGTLMTFAAVMDDGRQLRPEKVVADGTIDAFLNELLARGNQLFDYVLVLPAERKALSAFPIGNSIGHLALEDFRDLLRAAATASDRPGDPWHLDHLERVLGGRLTYTDDVPVARRVVFRQGEKLELPLHGAHSLVRALAGLWAYLKKLAQPGDVVIIDELEMNAHPHAQLMLTEFICVLVNAGLRVVFTTHSPYIVDHLSNLMGAAMVAKSKQKTLAEKFLLKTSDAFIPADKVAAHWFREDEKDPKVVVVEDILDRERGLIRWKTFADQSDWVANIYTEVLEARGPRKVAAKRKGAGA